MKTKRSKKTKNPMSRPIGARLRSWRKAMELTQKQAALEFGIPLRTWEKWEQAASSPRFDSIAPILDRLITDGY